MQGMQTTGLHMDVTRTIAPGQKGSIRFLKEWGEQLVNVRYRKDIQNNQMLTTIEIVVDKRPIPKPGTQYQGYIAQRNQHPVAIRVNYQEEALRAQIKQAGAVWSKQLKLWITTRNTAITLGIIERIVEGAAERCTDIDTSFL